MEAQNLPIGKLLQKLGLITEDQINIALDVQSINQKMLGEILIDLDFVTSGEIAEAIAIQNNLSFIDLDTITPSDAALNLIPGQVAISRNILPLYIQNGELVVASDGASDLITIDYLKKESKHNIRFVVSDKKKIARMAQVYYQQLQNPIEQKIKSIAKNAVASENVDVIQLFDLIINCAIKDRATDIHITPENDITYVFYRIDGVMKHYFSLPISLHLQLVARVKISSELDISEQRKPQDGTFSYVFMDESYELRISTLNTNFGENIVLRLLGKNNSLFSLSSLGFSPENIQKIEECFSKPYGIILVTGPTGSGKTTTLYSALRKINSLNKNILTVEDPVEYRFSFIKQTQVNVKSGYTFGTALKTFMRQDPDVMLVGEIRDAETAELAIRASITGHLVLSTLHTNNAAGTIPRLSDLGVPSYLIGSALLSVIGQRLARKLCPHCKKKIDVTEEELVSKGVPEKIIKKYNTNEIYTAVGCDNCRNYGYSGRVAIIEILEIDEELEGLIAENVPALALSKKAREKGMLTMRDDGYIKVLLGQTTFEEINRVVL